MASLLLIDGEEGITLALKTLFEKKGYDFMNACTGKGGDCPQILDTGAVSLCEG